METLIFPALFIYFIFHVLTRSDLCAPARALAKPFAPQWLIYVFGCALCFSFWSGVAYTIWTVVTTGLLIFFPILLFAVPVFNMVLDLVVKALIRANEPPTLPSGIRFGTETYIHRVAPDGEINPLAHEQTK